MIVSYNFNTPIAKQSRSYAAGQTVREKTIMPDSCHFVRDSIRVRPLIFRLAQQSKKSLQLTLRSSNWPNLLDTHDKCSRAQVHFFVLCIILQ